MAYACVKAGLLAEAENIWSRLGNDRSGGSLQLVRRLMQEEQRRMRLLANGTLSMLYDKIPIERTLSLKDFWDRFATRSLPVVVRNWSASFPQMHAAYSWDGLRRLCGTEEVELQRIKSEDKESVGGLSWAGAKKFSVFLQQVFNREQADKLVIFDESIASVCPRLLDDLWIPRYAANDFLKRNPMADGDTYSTHPSLFVQPAGTRCNVHVDKQFAHFMMVQLAGRKRWVIYPFDAETQTLALRRTSLWVTEVAGNFQWVRDGDIVQSDVASGRELDALDTLAHRHRVEVVLESGDFIFVPQETPHFVENLEPVIAVSLNYVDESNVNKYIADQMRQQSMRAKLFASELQRTRSVMRDLPDLRFHDWYRCRSSLLEKREKRDRKRRRRSLCPDGFGKFPALGVAPKDEI